MKIAVQKNHIRSQYCTEVLIMLKNGVKVIRVGTLGGADGEIKTTYINRNDIVPVKFDRIHAMHPVVIKLSDRQATIGHFPITENVEISNRLAFELIFGPYVYHSYQYFQV